MPAFLVNPTTFTPNMVEAPSQATIDSAAAQAIVSSRDAGALEELPPAIKAVRVQLRTVQVMDGLQDGFLGFGAANGVYVVTSVVDGRGSQPIAFNGGTYRGLKNGQLVPIGPSSDPTAVLTVYLREQELPRILSFSLLVLRSNQELRDLGGVITTVVADARYTKLSDLIKTAVSGANPAYGLVWQAASEAIGLIGNYLKAKPDDQLGYYQANYTNVFDDLGAGSHPPDRPTLEVDKIRLAYSIDVG